MDNKQLISVNNLVISVEQRKQIPLPLVKGISFHINKSEIVGLVGESGSGKSLTSLSILGLLDEKVFIDSGTIDFLPKEKSNSINLVTQSEKEMQKIRGREISMIFQEPMSSLNPLMKCGKQVDEMLLTHLSVSKSEAKKETLSLFDKVQLPDPQRAYEAYPHQLSGGQLQRIMIAMALGCKPALLIADECTTALDVTVQKEILLLLKKLNQDDGISILFISHDLDVVAEISDRVIVMKDGEIMEVGTVDDLFNHAKHPYTKQLIASKPPHDLKLKKLPTPSFFKQENANKEQFYAENVYSNEELITRQEKLIEADSILQVNNLVKFYPQKRNFWGKPSSYVKAVDHVSFDIKKGETVGLVGESGCGKSTLSKSIVRLIEADSGDVIFGQESFYGLRPKELRKRRKDIQYIFQDPYSSLNPRLTIGYSIKEPMTVHRILDSSKARKERTIELLEMVGLEADHYSRYPHQFSGGQRQRICIARALAMNPSVLICDEIVSALDVSVQAQVLNLLLDLRDKFGLSMLFVSHDLSIVKFICDRILVMNHGQIVESGWSEDIYHNPKEDYTKKLLSSIPGK